jgi:uroporphyrinogen decarboxylase
MYNQGPDYRRLACTLSHQEPDRVPLAEVAIDYEIMSQFLGREVTDGDLASQVEFWQQAGYDYIALTVGMMRPGRVTQDSQISKTLRDVALPGSDVEDDDWDIWKKPRIHSEADLETFPWERAAALDFGKFHEARGLLPDGMKIIATSGKIFTLSWMLMGFENFALSLLQNPRFADAVIEKVARIQIEGLRQIVSIPEVAAVWAVDDVAFGTGLMISPKLLRQHLFPWYEEFAGICRDSDRHLFYHSDGLLWDLLEDLIALGVDALHPIDPTCMDIEEVKDKVGDRLTLIGNISNEILEIGTPDEVAALTKRRIKALAPGGGYCLGSGNSVPYWAKIENYRAMLETARQHGRYPIAIP